MSGEKILLSKIYSREKSLFYFCVWDKSDREGVQKFIQERLYTTLFIVPSIGTSGKVWYSQKEINHLTQTAIEKINTSTELRKTMARELEESWDYITDYLEGNKKIADVDEMLQYYRGLVRFWSPISTIFFELPNQEGVEQKFRETLLKWREKSQHYTDKMSKNFIQFFENRFPEYTHLSHHITAEETVALERNPNQTLLGTLIERAQEGCFMLNESVHPMSGLQAQLEKNNLALKETKIQKDSTELSGTVAHPGTASGKVKVVLSRTQLSKVELGDILVATFTDENFIPALRKAAAFVTDEGGIMSHAAINAREMKKPCVIGTKFATQILKDGDFVEVDANKGIVRILKRRA